MVDLAAGGYAGLPDLAGWVDDLPDNAVRLLRSASLRVAVACQRNPYADIPSGSDIAPLRDATLAQTAVWIASGIDPADVAVSEAAVKSTAILDARVEYDTSTQARARAAAVEALAPEAVAILTAAGLIYQPVPVGDTTGVLASYGLSAGLPRYGYPDLAEGGVYAEWPFR